jgi:tRNA(fMet)-specific endonuclease VapC
LAIVRRMRLHAMVASFQWLPFQHDAAAEYGRLITNLGFSRTRILDRMIAAQAIVLDATLVTMHGPDFNDIPGLKLEIWPSPEAAD